MSVFVIKTSQCGHSILPWCRFTPGQMAYELLQSDGFMTKYGSMMMAVSLVACTSWKLERPSAALPPLGQGPAASAKICVVRTSDLARAVTFPTHDNGVLVGATRGPTYFCYLAEPGAHEISIRADEIERATLFADAGRSYYLKQEVDNLFGYVKCHAIWVEEQAARELFDESNYEVLVGVPGSEKLPSNPPFATSKRIASSR